MPTLVRKFARFAVVGVVATLTHTVLFAIAIEWLRIEPVAATALAFTLAMLVGYTLNRRWTFAARGGADAKLWRYMVAALIGLAANSLIMFLAVHAVHWSPYVGLVWSVLLMPPLTFALNHLWVFRPRK
jgi:putative flippase GtrA